VLAKTPNCFNDYFLKFYDDGVLPLFGRAMVSLLS